MPGFVHVDIPAEDIERAASFYSRAFGWEVSRLPGPMPYVLLTPARGDGPGAGISKREQASQAVMPVIDVASTDSAIESIVREGGVVVTPKTTIPGVGQLATFRDPEGNVLGVLEAERA